MGFSPRPMRPEEEPEIRALHAQAFNLAPAEAADRPFARPDEFLVHRIGTRAVVTARAMRAGQWFGGRAVPSALVASVAVAVEARGRGLVHPMLIAMMRREREAGMALSALHPSTLPAYRRVGYELAGIRLRYSVPVDAVAASVGPLERFGDADLEAVRTAYSDFAATQHGLIDRPAWWWSERTLRGTDVHAYLVRGKDRVTGYAVYTHEGAAGPAGPYYFHLRCRDLVWLDDQAAAAVLQLGAAHRQLGRDFSWIGPPADPLTLLMRDANVVPDWGFMWMLRILDPTAALERRGYPANASGSVSFELRDAMLAENAGGYRLEVSGGRGKVSRAASTGIELDCGTLAAMYSGWLRPRDAARLGRIRRASETDLATLDAAFAGPGPWMMDHF